MIQLKTLIIYYLYTVDISMPKNNNDIKKQKSVNINTGDNAKVNIKDTNNKKIMSKSTKWSIGATVSLGLGALGGLGGGLIKVNNDNIKLRSHIENIFNTPIDLIVDNIELLIKHIDKFTKNEITEELENIKKIIQNKLKNNLYNINLNEIDLKIDELESINKNRY